LANLQHYEFDTVISINVFEHLEDDLAALKNIKQVMNKGKVILVIPAHKWLYRKWIAPLAIIEDILKRSMLALLTAAQMNNSVFLHLSLRGNITADICPPRHRPPGQVCGAKCRWQSPVQYGRLPRRRRDRETQET